MRALTKSQMEKLSIKSSLTDLFEGFDNVNLIDISESEIIFENHENGDTYLCSFKKEGADIVFESFEKVQVEQKIDKPLSIREAVDFAFHIKTPVEEATKALSEAIVKHRFIGRRSKGKSPGSMTIIGATAASRKRQRKAKRAARRPGERNRRRISAMSAKNKSLRNMAIKRLKASGLYKKIAKFIGGKVKPDARVMKEHKYINSLSTFPFDAVNEKLAFKIDSDEATYNIEVVKKSEMQAANAISPVFSNAALTLRQIPSDMDVATTDGEDRGEELEDDDFEEEEMTSAEEAAEANESLIYIQEEDGKWNPYVFHKQQPNVSEARSLVKGYKNNQIFEEKIIKLLAIADQEGIDEAQKRFLAFAENWSGLYLLDESELTDMFIEMLNKSYDDEKLVQEGLDILRHLISEQQYKHNRAEYLNRSGIAIDSVIQLEESVSESKDSNYLCELHEAITTILSFPEIKNSDLNEVYVSYADSLMKMVKTGFVDESELSEIVFEGLAIEETVKEKEAVVNEYIDDPDFVVEEEELQEDEIEDEDDSIEGKILHMEGLLQMENAITEMYAKLETIDESVISDDRYNLEKDIEAMEEMYDNNEVDMDFLQEAKEKYGLKTVSGSPEFSAEHSAYNNQFGNKHQSKYEAGSVGNDVFPEVSGGSVKDSGKKSGAGHKYTDLKPSNKSNPEVRSGYDKGLGSEKTNSNGSDYYITEARLTPDQKIMVNNLKTNFNAISKMNPQLLSGIPGILDALSAQTENGEIDKNTMRSTIQSLVNRKNQMDTFSATIKDPAAKATFDRQIMSLDKLIKSFQVNKDVASKDLASLGNRPDLTGREAYGRQNNSLETQGELVAEANTSGKKPSKTAEYKTNKVAKAHDESWKQEGSSSVGSEAGFKVVKAGGSSDFFAKWVVKSSGTKTVNGLKIVSENEAKYHFDLIHASEKYEDYKQVVQENDDLVGAPLTSMQYEKVKQLDEYNPYYYQEIYSEEGGKTGSDKGKSSLTTANQAAGTPPLHPEYTNIEGDKHDETHEKKGHALKQKNKSFPEATSGKIKKKKVNEAKDSDLETAYANDYYAELNSFQDIPGTKSSKGLPKDTPNNTQTVDTAGLADKDLKKRVKNPATSHLFPKGDEGEFDFSEEVYDRLVKKERDACSCEECCNGSGCLDATIKAEREWLKLQKGKMRTMKTKNAKRD